MASDDDLEKVRIGHKDLERADLTEADLDLRI